MYTGRSQEQRMKARMAERRKTYKREKAIKLIASIIVDALGMASYVAIIGLIAYIAIVF